MDKKHAETIIEDCNILAFENLSKNNFQKTFFYLQRAKEYLSVLETSSSKAKLEIDYFFTLAKYYKIEKDLQNSLECFEKVLFLNQTCELSVPKKLELNLTLCQFYYHFKMFDKLIVHGKNCLQLFQNSNQIIENLLASIHFYLAEGYQGIKNFTLAEENYQKALNFANISLGNNKINAKIINKKYLKMLELKKNKKNCADSEKKIKILVASNETSKKDEKKSKKNELKIIPKPPSSKKKQVRASVSPSQKEIECLLPNIKSKRRNPTSFKIEPDNLLEKNPETPKQLVKKREISESLDYSSKKSIKNDTKRIQYRRSSAEIIQSRSILGSEAKNYLKHPSYKTFPTDFQVILIQKHWRGYITRKKFLIIKRKAAIFKANKALFELDTLKKQIFISEVLNVLPNEFKMRRLEEIFGGTHKKVIQACLKDVIKIQKWVKMFVSRKKFQKIKKSITKIKGFVKMFLVRSLYLRILSAIKFIQVSWKNYKKRINKIL